MQISQPKRNWRLSGFLLLAATMFILIPFTESVSEMNQGELLAHSVIDTTVSMERESITFILGEDQADGNPFYAEATNFYRYHPEERAEMLVTHLRSLVDVRNYLQEFAPENGLPWGTINFVVHSNEWQGMSMAVVEEGGDRATLEALYAAEDNGTLLPLPDSILDQASSMVIYGCGLGRNEELLEELSYALGGEDEQRPVVRSSKQFVYFDSDKQQGMPVNCKRYLSDYWYTHYPSFYHPGNHQLVKKLQIAHPEKEMDWKGALERESPRFPGDVFHTEFKIPIVWHVMYKNKADRPELPDPKDQLAWVKEQADIVAAAKQYGFDVEDFRWVVRKDWYEWENGSKVPAMKAIGFCSIVCVLKPVVEEDGMPVEPLLTDERFFGQGDQKFILLPTPHTPDKNHALTT